jgi:hypothetical protein
MKNIIQNPGLVITIIGVASLIVGLFDAVPRNAREWSDLGLLGKICVSIFVLNLASLFLVFLPIAIVKQIRKK